MPSLAVFATWTLGAVWLLLLGSPAGAIAARRVGSWAALRIALWFGLATALISVLIINFFLPLAGAAARVVLGLITSAALIATVVIVLIQRRRVKASTPLKRTPFPYWSLIIIAALALSMVAVAHAVFGAANNWDAGLYHLNVIQYASEYRVIPGLANLHDRFGVTNSQHLLTAVLSGSGWGLAAFRLEVGFFVFLLGLEIAFRLIDTRKSGTRLGSTVLLLAAAGLFPFVLSQSDEQLTSPTPDSVSMVLIIVATAFLVDGLRSSRIEWIATGFVTAAAAASVRSQLWAFVVITAVLLVVVAVRKRTWHAHPRSLVIGSGVLSIALLVTTQIRDVIHSGWILFPLDIWALPVDWRFLDPSAARTWIIAWAREPGAAPGDVMNDWSWVGGWIGRSVADWSVRWMLGCLALAATIWLAQRWRSTLPLRTPSNSNNRRVTRVLLLLIPFVLILVLWFLSAPDPRFAWGPIALLGLIPAAVAMTQLLGNLALPLTAGIAALLILPTSVTAIGAIDGQLDEGQEVVQFISVPWTITAALTPVPQPDVTGVPLTMGGEVIQPNGDDRCWQTFPLCTPYPNADLIFRGDSLSDGIANRYLQ